MGPRVARREVLHALEGASARAPAPVVRGPLPERHGEDEWDPEAETGRVVHGGLAVLDAILAHLPPAGGRAPREDIVAVRLIEPVPLPPGAPGRPSGVAPARVLAELPVAADGSFQVEVPAGSVIRFQALDADGLAVGHAHDRWYDVAPGQTLRLGIRDLATYRARCAACHGADDGDPAHAIGGVQAVSGASITLGRYEGGDPRRPLPAPLAGPATRREVDFEVDLLPILAACAACHDAPPLDLRPEAAYAALVGGGWAAGGTARTSPLAEVLLGRELDAADFSAPASPHGGAPAAAVAELLLWLDLGAAPLGSAP
jgi:cytochrome c553